MNPELYERYLAKKAKKLGISVEELKAQGTASPVKETETTQSYSSASAIQTPENQPTQETVSETKPITTQYSQFSQYLHF